MSDETMDPDDFLDTVPLTNLLAAVARRKEQPYESEADLLAAEASGWGAVAILERNRRIYAFVCGPYGTRRAAQEAVDVIKTNHRIAVRKRKTDTALVKVEVKPVWKEPH